MMSEGLDAFTHSMITRLSERGNQHIEDLEFDEAIDCFSKALDFLPEPLEKWEASSWLLGAIGDAYFLSGRSQEALQPLLDAMKCYKGVGNPFLHLRLGQTQFELGNDILAADELTRAYMGAGKEIFDGEDPKYFNLVKMKLRQPPSGW
jgi:tetratricopeptide (TPR) repeat protein